MVPNKTSDGPSTGGSMHVNLPLAKPPDRPTCGGGGLVEGTVSGLLIRSRMPVIAVRLHDKPSRLEHEVGLPASEHGLVHLEMKAALLELGTEQTFNRGVFGGKDLPQSSLAQILSSLGRGHPFNCGLAQLLSCLRRNTVSQVSLASPLPRFRRVLTFQSGLAYLFSCLWRNAVPEHPLAHPVLCLRPHTSLAYLFSGLSREYFAKVGLAHLFSRLRGELMAEMGLAHLLAALRRGTPVAESPSYFGPRFVRRFMPKGALVAKAGLAQLLTRLRGARRALTAELGLTQPLSGFWRMVASCPHVFNYDRNWIGKQ